MNKVMETAVYIEKDNCIHVLYDDGSYETIDCTIMDGIMDTSVVGVSRLRYLSSHEPQEYARMVLDDTLKDYIDFYVEQYESERRFRQEPY